MHSYLLSLLLVQPMVGPDFRKVIRPYPVPAPTVAVEADDQVLKTAGLPTTAPALLDFFRKRAAPAPSLERMTERARQLGGPEAEREKAAADLLGWGQAAVPVLRQAANNADDVEGSARARRLLQSIEGNRGGIVTAAAVRQLAALRNPDSVAVLLGFLPFAEEDQVAEEVESALSSVALVDGRPAPALLKALKDRKALIRGAAARALSRPGASTAHTAVRPLLQDPSPSVRQRAALGLARAQDAEAIPVLIDLLGDLPAGSRKEVEEFLTELAGPWAVRGPEGNDALSRRLRRETWATWWKQIDGANLLEELGKRTLTDAQRTKALDLIAKLGDRSTEIREKAVTDLVAMGPRVASLLRRTTENESGGVAEQVARCLKTLGADAPEPLPPNAIRLLTLRKPARSLEALLAYLPFAESDEVADQIGESVVVLGCPEGKPEKVLVRALDDKIGVRRAAAARALCRGHAEDSLPAVRRLLKDTDLGVRMVTALALAQSGEREAVPVLITLMGEMPVEQIGPAEDYLMALAGDKAPSAGNVSGTAAERTQAVKAWQEWWSANGKKIDVVHTEELAAGSNRFLVVEQLNPTTRHGRVLEVNRKGQVRWEAGGFNYPWTAQRLPNGNVLVTEQAARILERDRKGTVLWQKQYPNVVTAERLRNGHLFIALRNQIMVLDRAGKTVVSHTDATFGIFAARRLRDGSMAYVTYQGNFVRLNAAGKVVKTTNLPFINMGVSGADILSGDRVVVSLTGLQKVIEYDGNGKARWEAAVQTPGAPLQLPNRHTVLTSMGNRLLELNAAGKVISEAKNLPYQAYRLCRR